MELKILLLPFLAIAAPFLCSIAALESPEYTVVHSVADLEIRLYTNTTWMSVLLPELSFELATMHGFDRLFQYNMGANLNRSLIAMTTPVLTSIVPDAGPLQSSAYLVSFYLPAKFQASPPVPRPELNLQPTIWPSHCVAVLKFPGFAQDNNVADEAQKLEDSLNSSPWANSTYPAGKYAYSIAQYNPPFLFFGRLNEVWADVDGSQIPGCESSVASFDL